MSEVDEQRERAREAREALVGRTIVGRYVLRALLGHGGMGAVYEAEHVGLGKRFAIKFVDPEFATDERVVARFAREARAMSAIESAHIVTVFDAGTEDGRPFLVMELLRGEDLGQRLRRDVRVPLAESMHVVAQVLKGLARAHAAGIIHRDLKPDNVFLVRSDTDPLFAKIVDFGISKIERPRANTTPLALTGRGTVLGTPFYMSPEQAQAMTDIDARADLYSVGAILFECLTGRPPHTGESYEQVILSICMRDAPDLRAIDPKIPTDVAQFVARALSRERHDRYTSAERMLAALHEVAPAEKLRVPLDPGPPQTLVSPGAPAAEPPVSARTRLGVASLEPPTAPQAPQRSTPAAPSTVSAPTPEPATAPAPAPRKAVASVPRLTPPAPPKRSSRSAAVVATAAIATLTGVGATFAIISALDKKPEAPSAMQEPPGPSVPTLTVASTPVPSEPAPPPIPTPSTSTSTSISTSASPPAPIVTAAVTTSTKSVHAPKPTPTSTATSTSTKPLDIQRDLP